MRIRFILLICASNFVIYSSQLKKMASKSPSSSLDLNPEIIDFCSVTRLSEDSVTRKFHSLENLSYLCQPAWDRIDDEHPLDLQEGFQGPNHRNKLLGKKLDTMVEWLQRDPERLDSLLELRKTVFITFCGTPQTLMNMPYEQFTGRMYAQRYRNIVFLCEDKRRDNSRNNLAEYAGEKLEHLMLSSDPNKDPDRTQPVPSSKELCLILKIELDESSVLIYGAELDGLRMEERIEENNTNEILTILNSAELIELKTIQNLPKYKISKMYRQAKLSKVERVYCVYKGSNVGRVTRKGILETSNLPQKMGRSAQVMIQSLRDQIAFINAESEKKADLTRTFEFWCRSNDRKLSCDEIENGVYNLLPDDFIQFVNGRGASGNHPIPPNTNVPRPRQPPVALNRRHDDDRPGNGGDERWRENGRTGHDEEPARGNFAWNYPGTASTSPDPKSGGYHPNRMRPQNELRAGVGYQPSSVNYNRNRNQSRWREAPRRHGNWNQRRGWTNQSREQRRPY